MSILLVAINARKSHSNLALYYLKRLIPKHHKAQLLDHTINTSYDQILRDIIESGSKHILFSVYIWNKEIVQKLCLDLKSLDPEKILVLGGPEAEYNHQYWISNTEVDHIIKGQAEPWAEHFTELEHSPTTILHDPKPYDISDLPFPYTSNDLEDLEGRLAYYEASRGCQFKCSYCVSAINNTKVLYRDLDTILKELKILAFSKVKVIKMVDRTFNYDRNYAHTIWKQYISWNPPVPIHFEIHPRLLKDTCFEILKDAPKNLFQLEIGIQSTNKECLRAIDRYDDWNITKDNIKRLAELKNLHLHVDQIVGLPGANFEIEKQSFNDIISIGSVEFQMGFLKILPGTPLASRVKEFGIVPSHTPPYQVLKTASLSYDEMNDLRDIEQVLQRIYNSGHFPHTCNYLMQDTSSPFDIFRELSSLGKDLIINQSKRWEAWAAVLLEYYNKSPEIMDFLRLDWGMQAKAQFFPPILSGKIENNWQKREKPF